MEDLELLDLECGEVGPPLYGGVGNSSGVFLLEPDMVTGVCGYAPERGRGVESILSLHELSWCD